MMKPIYLDYAATTPMDPSVAKKLSECLTLEGNFGNPASSSHIYGQRAKAAVEAAREQVADLINANSNEIIWTSGATEANNLALKGVAEFYQDKGRHIITLKTEHKAVLDTCKCLQDHGFEVTYLEPETTGLLDTQKLKQAIRKDTILVSIMHVNNEIGVLQDIKTIAELCREHNIIFHSDCAQSAGKVAIDVKTMPVDLLSFSAHKIYGPKGMGALYVCRKPRARLKACIHGGGHEQGLRSGTLATQQIVAMGEAFKIAKAQMHKEIPEQKQLRDKLWQGIKDIAGVTLNGDLEQRVATNLNISVAGVEGGALLMALKDLAISTGSACTSATIEPSYVLSAIGVADTLAHSSLRITVGRFTTSEDIDYTIKHLHEGIAWLRSLAPDASDDV